MTDTLVAKKVKLERQAKKKPGRQGKDDKPFRFGVMT